MKTLEEIALQVAADIGLGTTVPQQANLTEFARSLVAALQADGWQMVPKEPTKTQVRSGQLGVTTTCAIAIYKAMIAAAPELEDL